MCTILQAVHRAPLCMFCSPARNAWAGEVCRGSRLLECNVTRRQPEESALPVCNGLLLEIPAAVCSRAVVLSTMLAGAAPLPAHLVLLLGGAGERLSRLQCFEVPARHGMHALSSSLGWCLSASLPLLKGSLLHQPQ